MENIAYQNPMEGGNAVYCAMVDYFNDTIVYDDDANCLAQGYTMKQSQLKKQNFFSLTVIPNPANDIATFTYTSGLFKQGAITIIDNLSRTVLTEKIDGSGSVTINLTGLNSGLYTYHLSGDSFSTVGKLILIKK